MGVLQAIGQAVCLGGFERALRARGCTPVTSRLPDSWELPGKLVPFSAGGMRKSAGRFCYRRGG